MFYSIEELIDQATTQKKKIATVMIEQEMALSGRPYQEIVDQMAHNLDTMEAAIHKGIGGVRSHSGLTGMDAVKLQKYLDQGTFLTDRNFVEALCYSVATNEVNAAMGVICATPTAGSAGVLPGVLFSMKDKLGLARQDMIDFLFCAAAFGFVVANNAFISGAEGGCQAEIGSACAMAAAAVTEAAGGTPEQAGHAFSLALKNLIGLACDPIAGLVEIPCINRNAGGSSMALAAAEMALAGIESLIPADEVVDAMYQVGKRLPVDIRETGIGGLAGTKTGQRIKQELFGSPLNEV